jgi:hypothetical protein
VQKSLPKRTEMNTFIIKSGFGRQIHLVVQQGAIGSRNRLETMENFKTKVLRWLKKVWFDDILLC